MVNAFSPRAAFQMVTASLQNHLSVFRLFWGYLKIQARFVNKQNVMKVHVVYLEMSACFLAKIYVIRQAENITPTKSVARLVVLQHALKI